MKRQDDFIKKNLQSHMQRIDDDSFTDKIIEMHLAKKQNIRYKPFINFLSLIIGVSSVIICIGLILLIRENITAFEKIKLNEDHGLILLSVSLIFLIYKWLEGLLHPKTSI